MRNYAKHIGFENYSEIVTWNAIQTVTTPEHIQKLYNADFRQVTFNTAENPSVEKEFEDGSYVDAMGVLMKPSAYCFDPVERLFDVFGTGGGYVFAPSHNIQPDVPMVNIQTLFEAANMFR